MNQNYVPTLGLFLFCLLAGIAAVYFLSADDFALVSIKSIVSSDSHSRESHSLSARRGGTTITVIPNSASFEIPESWLDDKPSPWDHDKNLFLTLDDLNLVNRIDNETNGFDSEDAEVFNAVIDWPYCAVHFGDKGWGNGLWNDLQGRLCFTSISEQELASKVENAGLRKALSVFERAELKTHSKGNWKVSTLEVVDAPSHFILFKKIEFFYRRCGDTTVVFAFLYASDFNTEIDGILSSFNWGVCKKES